VTAVTDSTGSRLPVAVLTGFLGSGKTTLLRRLLTDPAMSKTAVLINEFGEIGLDHLFVRSVVGGAVVLQNGCICCALRTDLQRGLRDLVDGRTGGTFPHFDCVVIETTGLADPAPIAQTMLIDPMLRHQVRLANIVTTVDAMHGAAQLGNHPEAMRQAAIADRIVVTKTDLVGRDRYAVLSRELVRLNPTSRVFDAHAGDFHGRALLMHGVADPATKLEEVRHWLESSSAAEHDHRHDGAEAVSHGAVHSPDIRSFSLRIDGGMDWTAFGVWLSAVLHRHGDRVLRVKGLLNVSDARSPIVLQAVQRVIHPPVHLDEWPDEDRSSRIVFIVQGIDPAVLERSLARFLRAASDRMHHVR
jgi:G3E family GTPase